MKTQRSIFLISIAIFSTTFFSSLSYAAETQVKTAMQTKSGLFKKLSDVRIDQIVELPYNISLISNIGKQVQVHNISEMQTNSNVLPEPRSLSDEFKSSFEYYNQREVLKTLSYKVGKGVCNYMEAVKVSDILVCFRKASENSSFLAPISKSGPRCVTTTSRLSHCYIFAHRVDDVVKAISE